MTNLTFLACISDEEENNDQLIISTDTSYRRQIYFSWGLLLLFAISLFGFGIYGALIYPGANLGMWCGFILLLLVLLFAATAKPLIKISIDPAVETITVTQYRIFLNELSSDVQTFSLAHLQKPRINILDRFGTQKTILVTCTDLTLTLRIKNHQEADFVYTYFNSLHSKVNPSPV